MSRRSFWIVRPSRAGNRALRDSRSKAELNDFAVRDDFPEGDCILKLLEELVLVVVIPRRPHSFGLGPGVDLLVLMHDGSHQPPHERQVLRGVGAHLAAIFIGCDLR